MSPNQLMDAAALLERHPALSAGVALAGAEACTVALARRHTAPTIAHVDDAGRDIPLTLSWNLPSERVRRAWRDKALATEKGAEMLAIVSVDASRGLVAVNRALRGSRVDFYLGRPEAGLEHAAVLEVAGIDSGSLTHVLDRKRRQASLNPDRLPALAVAVRFVEPRVMIVDVEKRQ